MHDLLGCIVVVRLDPLELEVNEVLGVEWTGKGHFWLDLLWFAFEVILVKKPTTHGTTNGQQVFRHGRLFGCGCFCGIEPGLADSDVTARARGWTRNVPLSGPTWQRE